MICPLCKCGWDSPCECGIAEQERAADEEAARQREVFAGKIRVALGWIDYEVRP